MTTEPLTLEEPRTGSERSSEIGLRGIHPFWLGPASGLAFWLCFPPAEWSGFAWTALVPLLLLVSCPSRKWAYLSAWAGGLAFWLPAIEWVRLTDPGAWPAWILMAVVLSAFWPLFLALIRFADRRLRLPLPLSAPIAWLTLEYAREYFLTGFPWYYAAHTQFRQVEILQIADFAGVWGVSFLVVLVNATLADLLRLPLFKTGESGRGPVRSQVVRVATASALVMATLAYGIYRTAAEFKPGPTLALLQSNLIQRLKTGRDPEQILAYYDVLVSKAIASGKPIDMIVWPETSYPFGYVTIDPALSKQTFQAQIDELMPDSTTEEWTAKRDLISAQLHGWVDQRVKAPMLFGTIFYEFHSRGRARYNSAVLVEPGRADVTHYHKMHLVPFGEYVPLISTFPWLTYLTPYRGSHTPSLTYGAKPTWIDRVPYRYAAAICFEDTLPHVVRTLFKDIPDGRQPDVLINQSNDGWFHDSTGEHVMHLACSVFRAIEHRVPMARSANTGVSAVIDGNGRILASLPTGTADNMVDGVIVETIPLDPREGLYTRVGDWLPIACLASVIGWFPLARLRGRPGSSAIPS